MICNVYGVYHECQFCHTETQPPWRRYNPCPHCGVHNSLKQDECILGEEECAPPKEAECERS